MINSALQTILKLVNSTTTPSNATVVIPSQKPIPTDVSSLLAFLLNFTALHDWIKLFLLGGLIESSRRFAYWVYNYITSLFFLSLHFDGDDVAYDWLMVWLSKQPGWSSARDLQISTRSFGLSLGQATLIPGEETDHGKGRNGESRTLAYLPSYERSHSFIYKRHYMKVTRSQRFLNEGSTAESLVIEVIARSHSIINALLLDAKRMYQAEEEHRVGIYLPDDYKNWYRSSLRRKRGMESIVLDPAVKDLFLRDTKEFLANEAWYIERGIPYRRGYLLYGVPGSGKTSLIHALAGELNLDIYNISLSKKNLDDSALNELICELPPRSIALIEDIDAAFTHAVSRDDSTTSTTTTTTSISSPSPGVTLSGLLGAIDGVAAQEGRLLFATTNKYEALDSALTRPGRMDIHVEFGRATKWQAKELFMRFFPVYEEKEDHEDEKIIANGNGHANGSAVTSFTVKGPHLTLKEVDTLATQFAGAIPEKELSMASLQGHLMQFKMAPQDAVAAAPEFVEKEREREQARLAKKEKEEGKKDIPVEKPVEAAPKQENTTTAA